MARELTSQEFKDICSSVDDPIRVVDKDLNIVWANEATRKIFGNDVIGRKCHDAFHQKEDPCEPYPCSTIKAFQDNEVSDFEIQDFDKSGEKALPHGVTNLAIRDEEGKLTAIIKITRDFSDLLQKKMELEKSDYKLEQFTKERTEKLEDLGYKLQKKRRECECLEKEKQESENSFRTLVESSPIGICIIQKNEIVYKNPRLNILLGLLPKRFNTNIHKAFDYIHPDDVEKVKEAYQQISSGRALTLEVDFRVCPLRRKNGDSGLVYISCNADSIIYQGEKAILLNLMDTSTLKKAEQLLQVRQKMSSLGHVAAGMAHEIRNPLTGINSYLYTLEELCEGKIIEGDQIALLKQIVSQFQLASDKIETVIKRVLDFSRPNPPAMNPIELNICINNALDLTAASLRKEGIMFEKSLEEDLPLCFGDFHLIEQVMLNLINNAIQAMKKKQNAKMILIESFCKKKSLCIKISDSGPGIPKETRDQVFDPFYTTNAEGTGIGLSIVQRIISDHHGTITILGNKNGGAIFSIELPIEKRTRAR